MSDDELDAFGNPIRLGGATAPPSEARPLEPSAIALDDPRPPERETIPGRRRPRRSPVPLLFAVLALAVTGVVLWQADRAAVDSPQVIARELDGHALGERSMVREANLRRALDLVRDAMRSGEKLLAMRITPAEVFAQVGDATGAARVIEIDLAFAVEARDGSTGASSTPLDLAAIDPAVPQRVVRRALRHAGVDDTHLDSISLTGAAAPAWYLTLSDVRRGDQSWTADLAGVAVTRPGELPPARGVEGASLMREANLRRALQQVAAAGRRLGRLRVAPQRLDADLRRRDGLRSVRVDAAQRVTVDDRPGLTPATIAVSRVPAGALERAIATIAREGVPARRVDFAALSLAPAASGLPPAWTIVYARVPAHQRTWRATLDGAHVERVG